MITWARIGFVFVALFAVTLVLLPFQLLGLAFDLKIRRYIPRYWHKTACFLLGIRIHVHGTLERRRPLMLACNHASWKDILVLGAIADVVFIAKMEVSEWPVFGTLAKLQKSIFVVREQKRRTGDQVNEIAERMAAGEIVVLFPEGTTSDGNRLLEVKSSLFGAAAAAVQHTPEGVVHVQPVAIAYTRIHGMAMGRYHRPIAAWPGDIELVPHLLGVLKEGALDVDVAFGETVDFRAGDNRKHLSMAVTSRLRRMLIRHLRGRDYDTL
ncbi:1-acyl-sn-glycerol-3-phosphate acyltransferase [Neorhizobium galegae]|uniref:lysophospholipid acyltransferase family protein n=1 Tax=Neorhizobium galegae TaxID=399 RepID=UPI0006219FAF|nr:1-acyl-sn-glycerol-3-phosphate acyltransferase [Neorhizobium galegae]MCQ1846599.1 1-acyl-sn-glycerol-3-phosphate acyltransferase [Neorhizobium galegae]CDZ35314.1 Phospholipid/glycerol acyltransferase [Neorhizobium galegae bv. officinalis]